MSVACLLLRPQLAVATVPELLTETVVYIEASLQLNVAYCATLCSQNQQHVSNCCPCLMLYDG